MKKMIKIVFYVSPIVLLVLVVLFYAFRYNNNSKQFKGWYFDSMKIDEIQEYAKGDDKTIGIIDSGCDISIVNNKKIKMIDLIQNGKNDSTGHGTQIITLLIGNDAIKGICPNANIISIKVVNSFGTTTADLIVEAINICIMENVDIICMSLGSTKYSSIRY